MLEAFPPSPQISVIGRSEQSTVIGVRGLVFGVIGRSNWSSTGAALVLKESTAKPKPRKTEWANIL